MIDHHERVRSQVDQTVGKVNVSSELGSFLNHPSCPRPPDLEKGVQCSHSHRLMARADLPGNVKTESLFSIQTNFFQSFPRKAVVWLLRGHRS